MSLSSALGLAALASFLPGAIVPWRQRRRSALFWGVLALALVGAGAWAMALTGSEWRTGLAQTLAVSILAAMLVFAAASVLHREAWRLALLLMPYLFLLCLVALAWQTVPSTPLGREAPAAWLDAHILLAVTAYGLLTLAAITGLAVYVQERALKARRPVALTARLPSLAGCERLQIALLATTEAVLALALATGFAAEYFIGQQPQGLGHKTVFSALAFLVIGGLLLAHARTGLRGRRAARVVLLAYLLLTLAYPGVRFVIDVLLKG